MIVWRTPTWSTNPRPLEAVAFALRWMRCGGGSAVDIESGFGCRPSQFFAALDRVLQIPPAPLHPDVVVALRAVARRRMWLAD